MSERDTSVADWWQTDIIDMAPGEIRLRGYPIEDLIGAVGFSDMIWLMTRGSLPTAAQARLLESALVAAVDHGPQAPSIATARMAVTCGLGLNGALASAVNLLDDVHGGAGEQAVTLFHWIDEAVSSGQPLAQATEQMMLRWQSEHGKFIPGFGHRFHKPTDPRAPRLLALVEEARSAGTVAGNFAQIARALQTALNTQKGHVVPMNIDGATAVIYAELGFAPALARGLFCLSRSVGVVAHAWEQMSQGGRNKGPTPPVHRWTYTGRDPIGRPARAVATPQNSERDAHHRGAPRS
ncbi:citryl-CoA lyase [Shimia sp. MMG029]|uniref:citryl-CoA lyase n=1 Tax=Shimia sp. MMG029 TaxID=3021978 RepID=UPI0022FE90AF|nr:citryl-CoA lyase [Shimia sp. MMG029]MDA5558549.1 citryl-CoA lyase [Shimia sp. MMG029]